MYMYNTVVSCWLYYSLHGVWLYACLFMDACEPECIILSLYVHMYVRICTYPHSDVLHLGDLRLFCDDAA